MTIETGVLVDWDCHPIHWHLPVDRSAVHLADSRDLWDVIWERRAEVLGFAHSHPGMGIPAPSMEDLTTFSAVELALGRRLVWWITSGDEFIEISWTGPNKLSYRSGPKMYDPEWLGKLRELSGFKCVNY